MQGTYTLAHYENSQIRTVKSFIELAPSENLQLTDIGRMVVGPLLLIGADICRLLSMVLNVSQQLSMFLNICQYS